MNFDLFKKKILLDFFFVCVESLDRNSQDMLHLSSSAILEREEHHLIEIIAW